MSISLPTFQLKFVSRNKGAFSVAELTSPLLDPRMHDASMQISFAQGASHFVIEDFEMASLFEYLMNQEKLRAILERKLDEHHENWDDKTHGRGPEVWRDVKVRSISLEQRGHADPQTLRQNDRAVGLGYDDEEIERISNRPDTTSRFTLQLTGKWTDGHIRLVDIRDLEVVEFLLE